MSNEAMETCNGGTGCVPGDCQGTEYKSVDVGVPIEVKPNVIVGNIETRCCGEPTVSCQCDASGSACNIVCQQRMKVKIPVKFGIVITKKNSFVTCDGVDCNN